MGVKLSQIPSPFTWGKVRACSRTRYGDGSEKVSGEWSLICTGHNLLKLFRFGGAQPR